MVQAREFPLCRHPARTDLWDRDFGQEDVSSGLDYIKNDTLFHSLDCSQINEDFVHASLDDFSADRENVEQVTSESTENSREFVVSGSE